MSERKRTSRRRSTSCVRESTTIDCKIVKLLNERAVMALDIRELKPKVQLGLYDPKREEQIFDEPRRSATTDRSTPTTCARSTRRSCTS